MEEKKNAVNDKTFEDEKAKETKSEAAEHETKESKKDKKSDIRKLREDLASTEKKLDETVKALNSVNDKYLRVVAEYDNFRKRTQAERTNVYGEAVSDTLSGLLPIIDNLQYAAKYSGGDSEKLAEGLSLILSKLPETLEKLNIHPFGEAGETFDPNLHNAILHVEDDNYGEGEIVEVLQCGYKYGDKVLRYAMVKVAN